MPVPVLLVAGFLGAGKTTVVNHLLAHAGGRRIAAVVNDFGVINIDAELIAGASDGVVSLSNGCICCSLEGDLLRTLANLPVHPDSVPINRLVQVEGTPLHGTEAIDPFDFVRTIAVARILMPRSMVRLSAGRQDMSDELQAMCFLAGANSIFYGEQLLTTGNPDTERDMALFQRLGLKPMQVHVDAEGHDHPGTVHADIIELPQHPRSCAA